MTTIPRSLHAARVWRALGKKPLPAPDIAKAARVSPRTARLHLTLFIRAGMATRAPVFPGYRYRRAPLKSRAAVESARQLDGLLEYEPD
jgi:DNA-binding IclR family transcriptional regulator